MSTHEKLIRQALRADYSISVRPLSEADGGGWLAEIPDLPGCESDGDTPEEALESVAEAKIAWIEAQVSAGRTIPLPAEPVNTEDEFSGRLTLRIPKTLHRRLARKAAKEGISLNQYLLSLISENHVRSMITHTVVSEKIERDATLPSRSAWEAALRGHSAFLGDLAKRSESLRLDVGGADAVRVTSLVNEDMD